ncbi:hypothetical protein HDU99_003580 [Rhizoclosmatium hyalinum]|nr:hypothetical protein HDU99_003580 [Rhizoclosmatium hyalinum]
MAALAPTVAETLTIKTGTDGSSLQILCVNDEEHPIHIKNEHFEGHVLVRVQNFRGVVPEGGRKIATVPYFEGRKRLMSFQFQGKFAKEWNGEDLIWSQDWDQPLSAPKMIGLFTKFWSMSDPGSYSEINSPTPYMRSYILTAMCTITSWKSTGELIEPFRPILVENVNGLLPENVLTKRTNPDPKTLLAAQMSAVSLGAPASGPGTPAVVDEPEEEPTLTAEEIAAAQNEVATPVSPTNAVPEQKRYFLRRPTNSQPTPAQLQAALAKEIKLIEKIQGGGEDTVKDRRKFFASEENRKEIVFRPDTVYGFEVFNPYFDPNEFKIKIPALTIDLGKVTNGQPMRLTLMNKEGTIKFFVVEVSVTQPEEVPASVSGEKTTTLGRLGSFFNKK